MFTFEGSIMNLDLSGKSALVSGSTQGIGRETAIESSTTRSSQDKSLGFHESTSTSILENFTIIQEANA